MGSYVRCLFLSILLSEETAHFLQCWFKSCQNCQDSEIPQGQQQQQQHVWYKTVWSQMRTPCRCVHSPPHDRRKGNKLHFSFSIQSGHVIMQERGQFASSRCLCLLHEKGRGETGTTQKEKIHSLTILWTRAQMADDINYIWQESALPLETSFDGPHPFQNEWLLCRGVRHCRHTN